MSLKSPYILPDRYGDPNHPMHPETSKPICGSYKRGGKLNKFGDPVCLDHPMTGRTRCRVHGGKSLQGIASATYEGKGHSRVWKALPERLRAGYDAATNDPNLLSLVDQIAVLDARFLEILGKLDTGEAGQLWRELREANDALELARQSGDAGAIALQVTLISSLIKRGAAEQSRWREAYEVADRKRKLVETMRKYRRDTMQFITASEQMMLLHQIAELIRANVKDRSALVAIGDGLAKLVAPRARGDDQSRIE